MLLLLDAICVTTSMILLDSKSNMVQIDVTLKFVFFNFWDNVHNHDSWELNVFILSSSRILNKQRNYPKKKKIYQRKFLTQPFRAMHGLLSSLREFHNLKALFRSLEIRRKNKLLEENVRNLRFWNFKMLKNLNFFINWIT